MKTMKKKIFNKATLLFLALMLMLTPLNFGMLATDIGVDVINEHCIAEAVPIVEEPIMTMSTIINPCDSGHAWSDWVTGSSVVCSKCTGTSGGIVWHDSLSRSCTRSGCSATGSGIACPA